MPRASQLLDPEVRAALEQFGIDPDTVPMDQMAIIAMRRELATLAAGRANKPNQSALMVAILADKVKDLATIEQADAEPEVEETDTAEAGRLAELWAAAHGLRLVPADAAAHPESADPYDPDTAGGARAAGGPRLVVVNSNGAE